MKRRIPTLFCLTALLLVTASGLALESEPTPERVMVPMPDGVLLATDIYKPDGDGPWPTIMIRSPYGGGQMDFIAEYFTEAGYVTAVQNVRGMDGSQGAFVPFINEEKDGLAMLDWIVEQSWSNGSIGAWGESYLGFAAMVLTVHDHPALNAVVNVAGMGDMEWFLAPGGAMHLMAHFPWVYFNMGGGQMVPWEQWMQMFSTLPADRLFAPPGAEDSSQNAAALATMFRGLEGRFDTVDVPMLHVAGWQDFVYESTLRTYRGVAEATDVEQRLIMGPWYHDQVFTGKSLVGEVDFGEEARRPFSEMMAHSIDWFDTHVKGEAAAQSAPVQIFVNGENSWHQFSQWPPAEVAAVEYFCMPGENGNRGVLKKNKPGEEATAGFTYDPHDPVPTLGGDVFHYFKDFVGYRDHASLLERDDVLVFSTPALDKPLTFIGELHAEIWLATSGKDADVTAWITIAYPDGRVELVEEGILRASEAGLGGDDGFKPGVAYKYLVDCGAAAWQVPAGAQVQLLISSSNFPKYVRNPGTGEEAMVATELKKTEQTLYMSPDKPSKLILPVYKEH